MSSSSRGPRPFSGLPGSLGVTFAAGGTSSATCCGSFRDMRVAQGAWGAVWVGAALPGSHAPPGGVASLLRTCAWPAAAARDAAVLRRCCGRAQVATRRTDFTSTRDGHVLRAGVSRWTSRRPSVPCGVARPAGHSHTLSAGAAVPTAVKAASPRERRLRGLEAGGPGPGRRGVPGEGRAGSELSVLRGH